MIVVVTIGYEKEKSIGVWIMASPYDKNLSKKSSTSEPYEYFSINEVKEKFKAEYPKNRKFLMNRAKVHCRKLKNMEPEDLIHETYTRFLMGTRKWNKSSEFKPTFNGAMQSIASDEYKKKDKKIFIPEYCGVNTKNYSIYENTPDWTQNQEEKITYKQEQKEFNEIAKNLLKDDQIATDFFQLYYLKDYTRKEVIKKLKLNDKQYNTLYNKILRRIKKISNIKEL